MLWRDCFCYLALKYVDIFVLLSSHFNCHACGRSSSDLISGCLGSVLYICGSGVIQTLVQYLYNILVSLPFFFTGFLPHSLVAFVSLDHDFFFSAIKTRDYFIGDLVFTHCGHCGWWLMPQFRLILVCPMHTFFESLPETWMEFLYRISCSSHAVSFAGFYCAVWWTWYPLTPFPGSSGH